MNKTKIKKIALTLITFFILSLTLTLALNLVANAYQIPPEYKPINQPFGFTGDQVGTGENAANRTILVLQIITGGLLYFAAPVGVLMVAISGLKMIIGGDTPDKLTEAKNGIIWTVIGLLVIILSYSIVRIVLTILIEAAG